MTLIELAEDTSRGRLHRQIAADRIEVRSIPAHLVNQYRRLLYEACGRAWAALKDQQP